MVFLLGAAAFLDADCDWVVDDLGLRRHSSTCGEKKAVVVVVAVVGLSPVEVEVIVVDVDAAVDASAAWSLH